MMDWISYVVDIEMTKREVRQHIFECGGATQAPFLPIATECDAERSNLDFDFVSVGSQVSLQAALQDSHSLPPQSAEYAAKISRHDANVEYKLCANVRQSGSGSDRFLTNDDFNPDVTCFAYPWTHTRAPTLSGLPERHPCICPHHLDPVHPDYSHSEIAVYTDGSFDPQDEQPNATWAFAVFEVYPGDDALRLIDWYADRVCLDPLDPCWIGATIDSIRLVRLRHWYGRCYGYVHMVCLLVQCFTVMRALYFTQAWGFGTLTSRIS